MRSMDGILNLYKPSGYTSHDAVARCKRFFGTRRVGHAGTLDPMACGVLPVLIGSACAAQDFLMQHDKVYRAGMRFGITTDTGDVTGTVLSECPVRFAESDFLAVLPSFLGKQKQVPPMYSAIKIDGKKLYELARSGVTVERKARDIEIYDLVPIRRENESDYLVEVSCSKGTYIRTLCEDIGNALGTGGALYSLERTVCGAFRKENAVTLAELEALYEANDTSALESLLISPEAVFDSLPSVRLSEFFSRLCRNGCEIYLAKLKIKEAQYPVGSLVRLYDDKGVFFAVGTVSEFPNGTAVKATVRFG